jgi:hypothetical protein
MAEESENNTILKDSLLAMYFTLKSKYIGWGDRGERSYTTFY